MIKIKGIPLIYCLLACLTISIHCNAKVFKNWGRVYDITYNPYRSLTVPNGTLTADLYVNNYIEDILKDKSNMSDQTITIVFPARNYIIKNSINIDLSKYPLIQNIHINLIGLKSDYPNMKLHNLKNSYLSILNENSIAAIKVSQSKVQSENYVTFTKSGSPKFIYQPVKENKNINIPNSNILYIKNSTTVKNGSIVINNNTFNMMGFEIIGEAFNKWPLLRPHPYFNTATGYGIIVTLYWKNLYLDNNFIHDHYGNGISVYTCHFGINPKLSPYQNNIVEITNNIVQNVYAFTPQKLPSGAHDESGDGILIWGTVNGVFKNNKVYNDLNITGMCGRLGIGGETFKNCKIEMNQINGYNRAIHIEKDGGGNLINKNRCTGSVCSILLSDWSSANAIPYPNVISNNYFSNENIPPNTANWGNEKNKNFYLWDGVYWSYNMGLIYFYSPGKLYQGTNLINNTFFLDQSSGSMAKKLTMRFIYSACKEMVLTNNKFATNCESCEYGMFISNPCSFKNNEFSNAGGSMIIQHDKKTTKGNKFTGKVGILNYGSKTKSDFE